MKAILVLLFLTAVVVYAESEIKYHPQAIINYLEMEDREMAAKVRRVVKLDEHFPRPSFTPSIRPHTSFRPTGRWPSDFPSAVKKCLVYAFKCHDKAKDDACAHLRCIKITGDCLHAAGVRLHHLPPPVLKCLPIIPCCMIFSHGCEEKLCCFIRFGECLKRLGDDKDSM